MLNSHQSSLPRSIVVFIVVFGICVGLGVILSYTRPATAASIAPIAPKLDQAAIQPTAQVTSTGEYKGPELCSGCHKDIHSEWVTTRHAQAFSSPIFQEAWTKDPNKNACLQCHTTGYNPVDGSYKFEGVTCESCHGPYQPGHPQTKMPITPDASLCATCHKSTTNEWRASKHSAAGIQCQACHDPHAQKPKADSINALCSNCHKDPGSTFTHGTHATAGLQCSNCHMYTNQDTSSPIGGLLATGHTFAVGSDTCIGCHRDTVHTRDKILALTGEVTQLKDLDTATLQQKAQEQQQEIASLKADSEARLYVGLAQGAIIGLAVGGVAAWIVSRRIRIVEDVDDAGEGKKAP